MARLSITVFADAKEVAYDRPIQTISETVTASSTQSDAITGSLNQMQRVRLCADVDTDVTWGANPTAVAGTSTFLPANSVEYFGMRAGDLIAVIEHS